MSIDYDALTTLIDKAARLFHAYRQDYLSLNSSKGMKGYLVCEDSKANYDENDHLRFTGGFRRVDISAHLKIEEPIRRREIINIGREVATILRTSPAFDHSNFSSVLFFHVFDETPKIELECDKLNISHNATLSPKAIAYKLKKKIFRLEKIPIDGPFLTYKVGGQTIHAPNPSYALLKYALFCDPALITLKFPDIPSISLVLDEQNTHDKFLKFRDAVFEEYADAPEGMTDE